MRCPVCAGRAFLTSDGSPCGVCVAGEIAIDIIVVNYRTPADLERFVDSVAHAPAASMLTIVDVAPTSFFSPPNRSTLIRTEGNVGYARACNMGAAVAGLSANPAPVLAFFNADVQILPDSLELCVETLFSQPDVAIVGPRQTDSRRRITSAGVVPTRPGGCKPRGWREVDRGQFCDVSEMMTVSGSAFIVRREAWDALAGCVTYQESDPDSRGAFLQTPHYFEETWLAYHARAHGWKVMYDGRAHMIHEWHRSSPVGGWADKQFKESQRLFRDACDHHGIAHD